MTRKMTITLEETLLDALDESATVSGKKKAQIVREALLSYLPVLQKAEREAAWREQNREAIERYNEKMADTGVFSDGLRAF